MNKKISFLLIFTLMFIIASASALALSTVTLNAPLNNTYITGLYTLNATTDATADNVSFYYRNGSSNTLIGTNTTSGTAFTYLWNTSAVTDGLYNLTANATNSSMDNASIMNYNITVDNTNPVISVVSPAISGFIADATVTLFNITLTEQNLNTSLNVTVYYKDSGAGIYTSSTLSCTGTAPTYQCSKTINLDTYVGDGSTLQFFFNTTDLAGLTGSNGSQSVPLTATVDETNPVVNTLNNYADNAWSNTKTLTFGFNVTETNLSACVLYHNASGWAANQTLTSITSNANTNFSSIVLSADGTIIWNVLCNDSTGHTDWFNSNYTLKVDSANPTVTLDLPTNNTWDADGSVIFGYTPTDTNIASCILYHNASGWAANITNSSLTSAAQVNNTLALADGQYLWNVWCNDSAGNSAWNATNYTIKTDNTDPVVNSIDNYADNIWTTSNTITFGFTTTDTNLDSCILYHNASGAWAANVTSVSPTSASATNFSSIALSDGTYLWNVWCNDSAGQTAWSSSNYTLKVDATSPSITLDIPTNNSWDNDGSVIFGYTPTDTNLQTCIFYHNVSGWAANITNTSLTSGTQVNNTLALSDGQYLWNVWCNDSAGNSVWNATNYTIKTDNTDPVVNSIDNYADNIWTTSNTITFGFTTTDTNLDSCILYHNASGAWAANVTSVSPTSASATNFSAITLADGTYLWNIWCNDSAGQTDWFTTNYTLQVDATSPTVTLDLPTNNTWDADGSVTFSYTPTDTNIDSCILYHNASGWTANITNSSLTSAAQVSNTLALADGQYLWNVWCNDSAGNSAWNTTNYTIKTDNTNPTLASPNSPTSSGFIADATATLFNLTLTEQNLNTSLNVTVYYKDSGAGAYTSSTLSCTGTAPTYQCSKTIDLDAYVGDGSVLQFFFNTTDLAGQSGQRGNSSSPLTATVDETNPVVNSINNYANNTWSNTRTLTFGFNITDTNIDTCTLYHNASGWAANVTATSITSNANTNFSSITLPSDGTIVWNVLCNDSAGQTDWFTNNYTLKVDATNPTLTLDIPTDNTWDNDGSVTLGYTPTDTNLDSCILYHNASGWAANTTNSSLTSAAQVNNTLTLSDGNYLWNALCNDSAGNSAWATANYAIKMDNTDPVVNALNNYANDSWTTSNTITFGFTTTDTNIDSCVLYHNASGWAANVTATSITSGSAKNFSPITLSDGTYLWNVWCNDSAGQSAWNSTNYTLKVDTVNPVIALNAPTNNAWDDDGSITFNYTPTDTNIDSCIIYHNASGWAANTTNTSLTSGSNVINAQSFADGSYIWNVWCNDSSGRTAWAQASNFTVNADNTDPVVNSINNYADNIWTTSNTITFGFTTTDTNIDSCILYHNASGWAANVTATSITSGSAKNFSPIALANGHYLWNVLCNDSAGQTDWFTNNYTLKVDTVNPVIALNTPTNNAWDDDGSITFNYTPTDTNIDSCILYHNASGWAANTTNTSLTSGSNIINTQSFADGTYLWNVWCNDSSGRTAWAQALNFTVNADNTDPVVNAINNYANNTWSTTRTLTFGFNLTDTNIDTCTLYHNASGWAANVTKTSITSNANTNFSSIALSADGTIIWNVLCNDSAGQTDWFTNNYTLNIDTVDPTITLNAPANQTWQTTNSINFNYTPTDTNINTCILYHNVSGWAANTTNTSLTSGSPVIIAQTIADSTAYIWNAWCNDSSGRTAWASANYSLRVDATNATAAMTALATYSTQTFTVQWNATDATSGVANYDVQVNDNGAAWTAWLTSTAVTSQTYSGTNAHTYYFRVRATDNAGNVGGYSANTSTTVATSAPTVTFNQNSYGPYKTNPTDPINVTFSDTNDLDYAQYKIGANGTWTDIFSSNYVGTSYTTLWDVWGNANLAEGTNTIYVRAYDDAGNAAEPAQTVTYAVDTTAPAVTITNPASGSTTDSSTILTVSTSETATCQYQLDSNAYANMGTTGTTVHNQSLTSLSVGSHTVNVNCTDSASNNGTAAVTWTVATGIPVITATSPNGTVTSSTQSINATTNEAATCKFDTSDQQYSTMTYTMTGTSTAHNYTLTSLAYGDHTYYVRCNDTAGNLMTVSGIITFTVSNDSTPPAQVTGVTALVWSGGVNRNIMINWTANTESDLNYYKVYINDEAVGTTQINQYTYPTPFDGTWTVNISAVDTSNNEGPLSTGVSITIDTASPSATGTAPSGIITDDTPTLYLNTSEDAACKFDTSDVAYASMTYSMTANGAGTQHNYTFTSALADSDLAGDYVYYVRCTDTSSNVMTTSSFISFVLDTDGNFNYTQWLYPTWDTLWLPDTGIMSTMGYTNYNISVMLSDSKFLHNSSYTDVYYYNGSSWAGYSIATGWAGSDLKYVNYTNDKPYWLKLNTTSVTVKTRYQI